jgi:DNA-binding NarL/FixJ family response regulator
VNDIKANETVFVPPGRVHADRFGDVEEHVLLVEDDVTMAETLQHMLSACGYGDVVIAHSCREARRSLSMATPRFVLLDLGLPDGDGVEFLRSIRRGRLSSPILVLTSATSPDRILAALRAGADGYLFKDDIDLRLAGALHDLLGGGTPLSSSAARILLEKLGHRAPASNAPRLSRQEHRVLDGLSTGASYAEIGRSLGIELNTVRTHVRALYEKLGVENRAEAVNLGWSLGLLHPDSH